VRAGLRRAAAGIAVALTVALTVTFGAARIAAAAPTAAFERPGGGPRSAAMGGHVIVLTDDDYAMGSNPARLAFADSSASAQYDRVDPGLNLWRGRLGVAFPLGRNASEPLQASRVHRLAVGAAIDVLHLGLIEGSAYREAALSVGGAFAPLNLLAFGVTARYERANSSLDGLGAKAWGVDVGATLDLSDHWVTGLAIRNALGRAQFDGGDDEDRPAEFTLGLATAHRRRFQAEIDYVLQRNTNSALSGGVEVHVLPGTLDLRAGVARELLGSARLIPSAGAAFLFQRYRLDYAFRSDRDGGFDAQHQLALGARF
jgi:hypothetical protein